MHVSSYPFLGSIGFDTTISDGVAKKRADALLVVIFCCSMSIWNSVPVKNFVVPVLNIQISLENDVLNNFIGFI